MNRAFPLLLIASIFLLTACKEDDDSSSGNTPDDTGSSCTFTCLIDGESFVANTFLIEDASATSSDGYEKSASGSFVSGGDTLTVRISMLAPNITDFAEGASFDAANGSDANRCFGTIYSSEDDEATVEPGTEEPSATALITSIDTETEVFSGTFDFEHYDSATETTAVVSNGVFTNISY